MSNNKKVSGFVKNRNFVPYEQLTDVPSRMYRKVIEKLGINQAKWKTYLDDYLRWLHPDDSAPANEVKRARSTALGNIQSTLFCSKTLTWNKFLTGLKIQKVSELEVVFRFKTESGEQIEIEEKIILQKERKSEEDN